MQKDLITSILAAIVGVFIAYFVCNLFIGEIKPVTIQVVDSSIDPTLVNPDEEIFNYRALNPRVETMVGECQEYDQEGRCLDAVSTEGEGTFDEIINNQPSTEDSDQRDVNEEPEAED